MIITTHLADDNDSSMTACGIPMPVHNRESYPDKAVFCQDCGKAAWNKTESIKRRAMYNYRVIDNGGHVLGVLSLETEAIPNMMMDGVGFTLGASWIPSERKFIEFAIMPDIKLALESRKSRIVSDPDLMDPVQRMG